MNAAFPSELRGGHHGRSSRGKILPFQHLGRDFNEEIQGEVRGSFLDREGVLTPLALQERLP
jgi:hypothetical protein